MKRREREQDLEIRLFDATWSNVTSDTSIDPSLSDYIQLICICSIYIPILTCISGMLCSSSVKFFFFEKGEAFPCVGVSAELPEAPPA